VPTTTPEGRDVEKELALTSAVARWAVSVRPADLTTSVSRQLRRILIDHLGAAIAGSVTRSARIVAAYAEQLGGRAEATVIGKRDGTNASNAAWVNGTAAHALDVDDGYTAGSLHPAAPTLPAVLALGEREGADPDTILVGLAIALELTCRLASAGHPATWRRGFHNTPLAGVMGGTVGAAAVLGADTDTTASALGIAGSHAGGLFEFLGSGAEVKRLHAGKAARDAVVAADLATRGLSGPPTVLEGRHGYLRAFAGEDHDASAITAQLGDRWALLDTYFKPYPCCRHLHAPIDAVLELRNGCTLDEVREVVVETHAVAARHDLTATDDLLDAQMSLPYAVVVALEHGAVELAHFAPAVRRAPRLRAACQRVTVRLDPELDARYPAERPARVTIRRHHGPPLVREVTQPLGEPTRPLDDEALTEKFLRLVRPITGDDRAERLVGLAWSFEDPEALMSALRFRAPDHAPGSW
jgi:2-methylcitrate dehydratase PrpD